jgi:hypothetical protein
MRCGKGSIVCGDFSERPRCNVALPLHMMLGRRRIGSVRSGISHLLSTFRVPDDVDEQNVLLPTAVAIS